MKTLTDCEKEVIKWAIKGDTIKETAVRLTKSDSTIVKQRDSATQKLGAKSFPQAMVFFERKYGGKLPY